MKALARKAEEQQPDSSLSENNVLGRLDPDEYDRLAPSLEDVKLDFKRVLYEQDGLIDYVYFIESGIVSLVTELDEGATVETGTIGNEGLVGLSALLGTGRSPDRAIVQVQGTAKRMPVHVIREAVERNSPLVRLTLRFTEGLLKMVSQTAACNRMHPVEERLSRWLLMTVDRVGARHVMLTQEFLAQMLGVHRPAVNIAGATLQRAGLIRYSRGKIEVIDRKGLEAAACGCYGRIRHEFKRVFEEST